MHLYIMLICNNIIISYFVIAFNQFFFCHFESYICTTTKCPLPKNRICYGQADKHANASCRWVQSLLLFNVSSLFFIFFAQQILSLTEILSESLHFATIRPEYQILSMKKNIGSILNQPMAIFRKFSFRNFACCLDFGT